MDSKQSLDGAAARQNWKKELAEGIKLCKEHGWLLSGGIAFLSALSIFNYSITENVPINLTSSTAIISLPAVFVFITFIVLLCVGCVLFPMIITFIPPIKGRPTHLSKVLSSSLRIKRKAWCSMLLALMIPAVLVTVVVLAFAYINDKNGQSYFLVAVIATFVVSWLSFIRLFSGRGRGFLPKLSLDFYMVAAVAALFQILTWTLILQAALPRFTDQSSGAGTFILIALIGTAILICLQSLATVVISILLASTKPITGLLLLTCAIVISACAFPPTGSALAGYVMQTMASGGRGCVVIAWSNVGLEDSTLPSHQKERAISIPLRLMAESGGDYLSRARDSSEKDIIRIPIAAVRGMEQCPLPQ